MLNNNNDKISIFNKYYNINNSKKYQKKMK